MAELNIKITTKYENAVKGANKVTESYKKLGNQMIKASQDGQGLDEAIEKYSEALSSALINTEQTKDGMAALSAQAKILKSEMAKVGLSIGEDNELYKNMAKALESVKAEMDAMPATTRKAASAMQDMEKKSGNAALKLLSVAKNILKFQLLMGPITGAIRGFKNTMSDSVKVAAEAEQTFNKLATVFDGVADSANKAASAISATLGVSKSTAAGALSTVGDLLQAQGMGTSESLTTASSWVSQFQDIIAFKDLNMSLEEFAQTFMSGAAGNLRNFRTFGSIVKESAVNARLASQGLDKLTGSELELAKMTARANIALEQQSNAIGATEREWDTMLSVNRRLNEAWKEYKENLGTTLNEYLKPAKSWLTTILDMTNDVTRALKAIEGGEFVVRVLQEGETVDSTVITKALEGARASGKYNPSGAIITDEAAKNASKKNARNNKGVAQIIYSAEEIAAVMKATGATAEMMREAAGEAITDDNLTKAQRLVNEYIALQEAIEGVRTEILASGEAYDNFTESLASLAHISVRSTNLSAVGAGINEYNYEDIAQEFGMNANNQVSSVIRQVLRQMGSLGTDAFTSDFDKVFGTGDKADAYASWLAEIESLYTILYNREVQFGDVGQQTLDDVIDMWGAVNAELNAYNAGLEKAKLDQEALATAQSVAGSYRTQLNNYGLSDYEITRNELQGKVDNARTGAEANLYSDALRDFNALTAKQLIGSFSGLAHAADMAKLGMTENEKALYDLDQKYLELSASTALTEADQESLRLNYEAERESLIKLQKATDDAAKAAAELAAWKSTGQRAAGSTGIAGQIYSAFQGDGDIWSKIINAVLAILENTESWPKIAEMLNQIFDMFEPVVDQMLDLLVSASPAFEIIIFCLKVIATAVSFVQTIINQIQIIVKGIWENIKTFFSNFGKIMTGRYKGGWYDFGGELNRVTEEGVEYLKRIWNSTSTIEKNTSSTDLKLLEDLWKRGIIDSQTYYKEAGSIQGTYVPGRVEADYPSYVAKSPSNSSVTIGNITINAPNGDINEIIRGLVRAGIPLDTSGVAIA